MRRQEFLDSHIQLVFTFWGLWTHKPHKNSYNMNRKGFFFPPILVFSGQKVERLIQKTLMEKCYLK